MSEESDNGDTQTPEERSSKEEIVVDSDRYYPCVSCGHLKHEDRFQETASTCEDCHNEGQYEIRCREAPDGDGYLFVPTQTDEREADCVDTNLIFDGEYLQIRDHPSGENTWRFRSLTRLQLSRTPRSYATHSAATVSRYRQARNRREQTDDSEAGRSTGAEDNTVLLPVVQQAG